MKTTGLHSPFIDGELLGAPPPAASPFEQVMAEPRAQPMPPTAASGVRVVDAKGDPLSGVAWSLHQGSLVLRGTLDAGEADVLVQGAKSFDRSKPFRFHVEGHVCSIVSGAALLVDEAGVEYGGSLFDWRAADSADAGPRSAFWKDYAARRQQDEAPHVFRFIQHDHVMRRPVRWLKGTNLVVFQAQPLAIRLGPVVRYTDDRQARIWLELNAPGLVRVQYGPAPDARKKPASGSEPASLRTRHTCSVRVGGRHYAMLTLDELPADAVVMYTLELAPQPPTGPLPGTEGDFTEARFPRQLPAPALAAQRSALAQISLAGRHWLYLRTLPSSSEGLRFAHGSCRVHPGDTDEHQQVQGADMLARFGSDFLATQELSAWPQFFMHTGDQIYADDIGVRLGRQLVRQRFSATEPGPRQGDVLLRGAWGGRFASRIVPRKLPQPSTTAQSDVDEIDRSRNTAQNPARVQKLVQHARSALAQAAVFAGATAPAAQKLQVLNQLLWQPPINADDVPQVDPRRGLLQAPTFRVQKPQPHEVRLPHPAAGDIGGVHLADYAEYAAAYEQAWAVHGARRGLAHLPNYMIFDDHEVTDDWNADAGWLACVHSKRDPLRMWPHTMTDALAAYWLYQGWGNLAPAVAAADPRVQILERARHQGHDALPELRRLIHDRAVAPTAKQATPAQRGAQLAWHFRVPTPGTPFLVLDLRTDRDVHGSGGMSKARLDWLETALRAARTRSAFIVLPVPLLMPAPLVFAMQHPWVGALATGADSTDEFRRKSDIEHPVSNLVWAQFRDLLQRLQRAGSSLRTLAIVSGDIHFSCNLDGQLPDSKQGPRLVQLISSGLCKVVSTEKQGNLASAYRGWLHMLTSSRGVDTQRGVRMTLGGLEGPTPLAVPGQATRKAPKPELRNFVFPTSVALVDVVPTRTQPAGRVLGDTALVKQVHFVAAGSGQLDGWAFNHATRAEGGWMTLNDPGLGYTDRPDSYPRDSRPMGLVREVLDELEAAEETAEPGGFELVHEALDGEAEPTLELVEWQEEPQPEGEGEGEPGSADTEAGHAFDDHEEPAGPETEDEILGTDQRTLVADTLAVPHRWICALDVFFDTTELPRGTQIHDHTRATGLLIGPRHVLTARHVIEPSPVRVDGDAYRLPVTKIRVTPARCGDNRKAPVADAWAKKMLPAASFTVEVPQVGKAARRFKVSPDYALLVLDRDLAAKPHARFKRLGYWGEDPAVAEVRALDLDQAPSGDVTVAGYPGDTCGKTILLRKQRAAGKASEADLQHAVTKAQRDEPRQWASRAWEALGPATVLKLSATVHHMADTFSGQSGAPVMQQKDGVWQLLAVHHGPGGREADGSVVNNSASALTARALAELCRWINQDAGRTVVRVTQGRLVFDAPAPAAAREWESFDEPEADGDFEAEPPEAEDETPRAGSAADAAARIHQGLRLAEAWLRRRPRSGVPELLRFAISLLRTHFFPKGHGLIDGAGHVARQAPAARIAMQLRGRDGASLPFEHRVRLWIDARPASPATVAGRHADALFSSITLHAPAFAGLAPTVAQQHAVHEVLHMLFTLVERLRQRHGDAMADAFLQKDPWSLLDLRRFDAWRGRLEQALQPLLHLLGAPEPAVAAAGRLVEEAFCFTGGMHLRFTLERGDRSGIVASSVTETLVRHYVLDHAPRLSALLGSDELAKAVAPLRPVLDELQDRMNADWQGGMAAPVAQPEALFEPV